MEENRSTDSFTTFSNSEVPIPHTVRFWLLLILDIPAVIYTLFILFHLFLKRTLRQALNNHAIMVLLIVTLTFHLIDIPSYITFVRLSYVWLSTSAFYSFWSFVAIGLFNMLPMLMAFGAIERHILVFHRGWISTRKKRFLIHYVPLVLIIIYCVTFYVIVLFFPPCENVFDYTQPWCSYPCYYDVAILLMYDTVVNAIFPTLLIILFNVALFLRYIRQKRRIQRVIQWRKHRKMVIQLLLISLLHLVFDLPVLILITAHLCGLPQEVGAHAQLYAYFFTYFIPLFLPYVCLASLPELWKKLKVHPTQCIRARLQRTNTVVPIDVHNRR